MNKKNMSQSEQSFFTTLPNKMEQAITTVINLLLAYSRLIALFMFRPVHAAWVFAHPNSSSRFYISPLLALSISLFFATMLAPTQGNKNAIDFFTAFASRLTPDFSLVNSFTAIFPLLLISIASIWVAQCSLNKFDLSKQNTDTMPLFQYTLAAQFGAMFLCIMASQIIVALAIHGRITLTSTQWNIFLHSLSWIGVYIATIASTVPAIATWNRPSGDRPSFRDSLKATTRPFLTFCCAYLIFVCVLSANSILPLLHTKPAPPTPATHPTSTSAATMP